MSSRMVPQHNFLSSSKLFVIKLINDTMLKYKIITEAFSRLVSIVVSYVSSSNSCKVRILSEVVSLLKMFTFMSLQSTFINCTSIAYRRNVLLQSIRPCFFKFSKFEL